MGASKSSERGSHSSGDAAEHGAGSSHHGHSDYFPDSASAHLAEVTESERVLPSVPRLVTMGRKSSHRYSAGQQDVEAHMNTEKSPEDAALIFNSLSKNPNMKKLAPFREQEVQFLVASAWREDLPTGGVTLREGSLDNNLLYIVASGSFEVEASDPYEVAQVEDMFYLSRAVEDALPTESSPPRKASKERDGSKIRRKVGPKTCFGDSSLLYNAPRWCTCTALEPTTVWVVSQANFRTAQLEVTQAHPTEKGPEDIELIKQALLLNDNLQRLTPLTSDHIEQLVKVAWANEWKAGQVIMREGDLNADALYIVGKGCLELTGSEPFRRVKCEGVSYLSRAAHTGAKLVDEDMHTSLRAGRGLMFGEISMLYCAPRFATITAVEDVVLWAVDRASFQLVQVQAANDEVLDRVRHLEEVPAMKPFSKSDKEKMAVVMETMRFSRGEELQTEGQEPKALYIVLEGTVETEMDGRVLKTLTADPAVGRTFGEEALHSCDEEQEVATVRVVSESAKVLRLDKEEFQKVWDRLLEAAPAPTFERFMTSCTKMADESCASQIFALDNLVSLGLLGAGSLGPIELHRHKKTKELYAVKKMSKGLIMQRGLCSSVLQERIVWMETISPFIVRLYAAHRESQTLSYVLEFAGGGELSMAYTRYSLHGSDPVARHILAGIVLAFTHLHKRKIIYRNLKPQNVLLTATGQPKITDFGIAKRINGFTFTTCGTPTYMAPEILTGSGHTRAVDWWSLGILMFWLKAGYTPFDSAHPMEIYAKALRGIARIEWPSAVSGPLQDLICCLLQPVAIDRIAMKQGGSKNVMTHEWFKDFKWEPMRTGTMEAPFVPKFAVQSNHWRELPDSSSVFTAQYAPKRDALPTAVACDDLTDWDDDFPSGG